MIVDVHAHYFPKAYTDLLLRIGGRSLPEAARPLRQDDPAGILARLQQMAEAEVQMQVLSPAADVDQILNHNAQILLGLEH
jgi:hypothetical protein